MANLMASIDQKKLRLILQIAAYASLAAGALMGGLALAGPLAVWLGLADFRFGFGLLRTVNAWAGVIALITLVLAIAVLVIAHLQAIARSRQLAGVALVGTITAALAWYIPETFRPPEGTPAIHDIATDPENPLEFIAIAPLRANAANNMEYGVMPGMEPDEHRRLQREAYPEIVPQRFSETPQEVFARALATVESLGWDIVEADAESGRIEATDTTFWFRFKDDVVIEVTEDPEGAVLNARSLSRVGRSDVGKNAARLRELFELLRS